MAASRCSPILFPVESFVKYTLYTTSVYAFNGRTKNTVDLSVHQQYLFLLPLVGTTLTRINLII